MVEHRRRQIQPDSHFGVGQGSYVTTDGGLRAAKGRHGEGVRANLGVRFAFFDQRVLTIRGKSWDRETLTFTRKKGRPEDKAIAARHCCTSVGVMGLSLREGTMDNTHAG